MRIAFTSVSNPKDIAKSIQRTLKFLDYKITLSQTQNITAMLAGFRDWHELSGSFSNGTAAVSSFDSSLMARKHVHERLVALLQTIGISPGHAQFCASTLPMSEFHSIDANKGRSVCDHFIAVSRMLGGTGFRLMCQGEMHGTVQFRIREKWIVDPRKRTRLATEIVALTPYCGGYSAVWNNCEVDVEDRRT
jgi:hypothetical protein